MLSSSLLVLLRLSLATLKSSHFPASAASYISFRNFSTSFFNLAILSLASESLRNILVVNMSILFAIKNAPTLIIISKLAHLYLCKKYYESFILPSLTICLNFHGPYLIFSISISFFSISFTNCSCLSSAILSFCLAE